MGRAPCYSLIYRAVLAIFQQDGVECQPIGKPFHSWWQISFDHRLSSMKANRFFHPRGQLAFVHQGTKNIWSLKVIDIINASSFFYRFSLFTGCREKIEQTCDVNYGKIPKQRRMVRNMYATQSCRCKVRIAYINYYHKTGSQSSIAYRIIQFKLSRIPLRKICKWKFYDQMRIS